MLKNFILYYIVFFSEMATFSFESKIVATGGLTGELRFFDLLSGDCLHAIPSRGENLVHINKIVPKEKLLAVCGNPWIRIHPLEDLEGPPTIYSGAHTNNVTTIGFNEESKWFVSAGEDGKIFIWDLRASGFQTSLNHGPAINCGSLHPNQGVFVYGDQEGFLNVFDLAANRVVRSAIGERHTGIGVSNLLIVDEIGSVICTHDNRMISILNDPSHCEAISDEFEENQIVHDDSSPKNGLCAPPMLLPLISRSVSSPKPPSLNGRIKDHTTLQGPPCTPLQSIGQEFNDSTGYITSIATSEPRHGEQLKAVCASFSTGVVRIWRQNNTDKTLVLDGTIERKRSSKLSDTWCWDTKFVDRHGQFVLSSFSDGTCVLSDATRPLDLSIAVHPFGLGKPVRNIAILDKTIR